MKRISFFVVIATFILTSCTKGVDVNVGDDTMSFGTKVNIVETKSLVKSTLGAGDRVGVFAQKHTSLFSGNFNPAFLSNSDFVCTDGSAMTPPNVVAPDLIWASTGFISFMAYHPYTASAPTIVSTNFEIPWTVNSAVASQQDFLLDVVKNTSKADRNGDDDDTANNQTTGNTNFKFDHLLSKIHFFVKEKNEIAPTPSDITILSITITDIKMSGKYQLPINLASGGVWNTDGVSNTTFAVLSSGIQTLTSGAAQVIKIDATNTADAEQNILMIPQDLTTGGTAQVTFVYNFGSTASNVTAGPFALKKSPVTAWEKNKVYNYTLSIDGVGDAVSFDCAIDGWGTALDENVTI